MAEAEIAQEVAESQYQNVQRGQSKLQCKYSEASTSYISSSRESKTTLFRSTYRFGRKKTRRVWKRKSWWEIRPEWSTARQWKEACLERAKDGPIDRATELISKVGTEWRSLAHVGARFRQLEEELLKWLVAAYPAPQSQEWTWHALNRTVELHSPTEIWHHRTSESTKEIDSKDERRSQTPGDAWWTSDWRGWCTIELE